MLEVGRGKWEGQREVWVEVITCSSLGAGGTKLQEDFVVCVWGEFEELPKEDSCTGLGEIISELKG